MVSCSRKKLRSSLGPFRNSLLKNGLFVRHPLLNALLIFLNNILRRKKIFSPIPSHPQKILLCNIANFGDVVISTAVLPLIKKKFPDCEIGFMTSSVSSVVLKEHPLVTRIHHFDHWYFGRGSGLCKAVLHHWMMRRRLLKELKQARYDVAIDLYSYFPNAIPVLAKSQIPIRIGYATGGFSNLLTHVVEWNFYDRYVGYAHLYLLSGLGIDTSKASPLPFYNYRKFSGDYIVVHMGSLNRLKEWDPKKWVELIQRLEADGHKIILTGKGNDESKLCKYVADRTLAQNLSDQLNWREFVVMIQESRLLISVDSAAVHIAAGALIPTLSFFTGINASPMWSPPFPLHTGMMKSVPCAPCFKKNGCSQMTCIQGIDVAIAYKHALKLLKQTACCRS